MSYEVEGDYFEACNCLVNCRCIHGTLYDGDKCDAFLGWHVLRGQKDGVDLAGLNVAIARQAVKDKYKLVELYIDERASPAQRAALEAIFSGAAGGHLANIAPIMGKVSNVHLAPIEFLKQNDQRSLKVGEVLEVRAAQLVGMDRQNPSVSHNPLLWHGVDRPFRQGKAERIHYDGAWKFECTGTNSFIAEFQYRA
jgi:hypothetical protein